MATEDLKLPERLGRYDLIRELGRGATGVVWLARQPELERNVAIKVLFPELTSRERFVERFQREAQVAASLRHPHIVQVHDATVQDGFYYIAMEYLGSRTLQAHLADAGGKLPPEEAVRLADQLLSALEHAHGRGIIHRDIKPANVMLTEPDNQVVLTDFSIARLQEAQQLTQTGTLLGTPEYMAPEQFDSSAVDGRADLYSVGVMLYCMLTGRKVFKGTTPMQVIKSKLLNDPPPPLGVAPALATVVMTALRRPKEERYARAEDMREALRQALAPAAPAKVGKPKPPPRADAVVPVTWEGLIREGLSRCRTHQALLGVNNLLYALQSVDQDPVRKSLTLFAAGVACQHADDRSRSQAFLAQATPVEREDPSLALVVTALEEAGLTSEAAFLRDHGVGNPYPKPVAPLVVAPRRRSFPWPWLLVLAVLVGLLLWWALGTKPARRPAKPTPPPSVRRH